MQQFMTIENEELRFYSFELKTDDNKFRDIDKYANLKQIIDSNLKNLYCYYLEVLNDTNRTNECELIENYMQSLEIELAFAINISRSLRNLEHLNQTKGYPYEIILEGLDNQEILNYLYDNNLLHFKNKTYIKK